MGLGGLGRGSGAQVRLRVQVGDRGLLSFLDTFKLTSGRIIHFHLHFIGPDFVMWPLLVAREAGKCSLCVGWEVFS